MNLYRVIVTCLATMSLAGMEVPKEKLQENTSSTLESIPFSNTYLSLFDVPNQDTPLCPVILGGKILPLIILNEKMDAQSKISSVNQLEQASGDTQEVAKTLSVEAFYKDFMHKMMRLHTLAKISENTALLKNQEVHAFMFDAVRDYFLMQAKKQSLYCLKNMIAARKALEAGEELDNVEEKIFKLYQKQLEKLGTENSLADTVSFLYSFYSFKGYTSPLLKESTPFLENLSKLLNAKNRCDPLQTKLLEEYVASFYQNIYALKNWTRFLVRAPLYSANTSLFKSVNLIKEAFDYYIDPLFIKSYLPTAKAIQDIREFLEEHPNSLMAHVILLIAAQTGNKDLAALAIEKQALGLNMMTDLFAASNLSPLFEKLTKAKYFTFPSLVSCAQSIAQRNNQNELYTFLENATIQSPYFKEHKKPDIIVQQYTVVQQQENSSRASGYYAVINALHMLYDYNSKKVSKDSLMNVDTVMGKIKQLRSDIIAIRSKRLITDIIHDLIFTHLKGARKIGSNEIKKYKKEKNVLVLPLILENSSILVPSQLLSGLNEKQCGEIVTKIAKNCADQFFSMERKMHLDMCKISDEFQKLDFQDLEFINYGPQRGTLFIKSLDFPFKSFDIEVKSTDTCISCELIISGLSKVYSRSCTPQGDGSSVIKATAQKALAKYVARKWVISDCLRKNKLTEVSPNFITSLIKATNEWDQEMIERMIENACKMLHKQPEKVMHEGESPLLFDENNNMPVHWNGTIIKTDMDKHLYAQWRKIEAKRVLLLDKQNKSDTQLASDWLSLNEIASLILPHCKNVQFQAYYCSNNDVFKLESTCTGTRDFDAMTGVSLPAIIFLESYGHWFTCFVVKSENDKIRLFVADSKNIERSYDALINKVSSLNFR